ncbi:MAG: dihydrofolate reductase [Gemmatimonadales bacterium]
MIVSLVAAMSENGVIGMKGDLPWHLPTDLARFKELTTGHTIIMGRKTFDSVGRPLPNRRTIVVTRDENFVREGVVTSNSIEQALTLVDGEDEVFVVGGGEIYRLALPLVDRIYLTVVHAELEGDTFFPHIDTTEWTLVRDERHEADAKHGYAYSFQLYERLDRARAASEGDTGQA